MSLEIEITRGMQDILLMQSKNSGVDKPKFSHVLGSNQGAKYIMFGVYGIDETEEFSLKYNDMLTPMKVGNVKVFPDRVDFSLKGDRYFSMPIEALKSLDTSDDLIVSKYVIL